MKKIYIGVMALALLMVSSAPAGDNAPWLKGDITYKFALSQGYLNSSFNPPWPLAWEGTIQGDVDGVMRWWVDLSVEFPNYVGRFEVWDCLPVYPISCDLEGATVIMAGYGAGTNFAPVDGVGSFSGKGVVTFVHPAYPQYAKWFGRRTTEDGWYDFVLVGGVPTPNYGEGTLMFFDRPSNKH